MVSVRRFAAFSVFLVGCAQLPAFALLTDRDVVNAVERSKVLPPNASMSARVNKEFVQVATYRNEKANDSDTKIEAVLIAKAIMEAGAQGEVTRVSCFFYSKSQQVCKEVSVTTGDVKAFGSGQTGDQELISSLVIKDVETKADNATISSYLRQNRYGWPDRVRHVDMKGDDVYIDAVLDPWITEKDAKLESVKMAEKTVEAFPQARKVYVTYTDPAFKTKQRQISLYTDQLKEIAAALGTALSPISMNELKTTGGSIGTATFVGTAPDLATYTLATGTFQDEREVLLKRIKALKEKGVGVGPFFETLLEIDKKLTKGVEIEEAVKDLDVKLYELEKANNLAKEFVPVGPRKKVPAAANPPMAETDDRFDSPAIAAKIRQSPEEALNYWRQSFSRNKALKNFEDHPNYVKLLDFFGTTLRAAKRDQEAATYEAMAKKIRERKAKEAADKAAEAAEKKKDGEAKKDGETSGGKPE